MNKILFNLNQSHIKVHCHRPQSDVPWNALVKHIKRGNNKMFKKTSSPTSWTLFLQWTSSLYMFMSFYFCFALIILWRLFQPRVHFFPSTKAWQVLGTTQADNENEQAAIVCLQRWVDNNEGFVIYAEPKVLYLQKCYTKRAFAQLVVTNLIAKSVVFWTRFCFFLDK